MVSAGKKHYAPGRGNYGAPSTKAVCINFATVVISTVGLIALVLGYCCLGGAVFEWLESNTENETIVNDRRHVEALVKQHAADLYAQLQLDAADQSIDTVTTISGILDNVSSDAFIIAVDSEWDGEIQGSPITLDWTLPGAILFSVTTITTIGKSWFDGLIVRAVCTVAIPCFSMLAVCTVAILCLSVLAVCTVTIPCLSMLAVCTVAIPCLSLLAVCTVAILHLSVLAVCDVAILNFTSLWWPSSCLKHNVILCSGWLLNPALPHITI